MAPVCGVLGAGLRGSWCRPAETLHACSPVRSLWPIRGTGLRGSWRESAETLQACSVVRSVWPIHGTGLQHSSRLAPWPSQSKCNLPCFCTWRPFSCPGSSANHGVFALGDRSEPRFKCESWRFCTWGRSEPRVSWVMRLAAGWGIHSVKGGKGDRPSRLTANASLLAPPSACLTVLERTPSCCKQHRSLHKAPAHPLFRLFLHGHPTPLRRPVAPLYE